jgi:hypothetical protein
LTVNLPEIIESTLKYELTPTSISVQAKAGKYVLFIFLVLPLAPLSPDFESLTICSASKGIEEKDYEFKLDFYSEVVPEVCFADLFFPSSSPLLSPDTGIIKKALNPLPVSRPPQKGAQA